MDFKIFVGEVSVFGTFLKIERAEETDIFLSVDFNKFPKELETTKGEKILGCPNGRIQKLRLLLTKHDLHDLANVNQNFEHIYFDKKNGFSTRIDFVFTNSLRQFSTSIAYSELFLTTR